jgi:hypothetical protein
MTDFNLTSWQGGQTIFAQPYVFLGYAQYAAGSMASAISLNTSPAVGVALPAGTRFALITVEGAAIRYREDGTAPTAAIGQPMSPNAAPLMYSGALSAIQFIQQSAGAILNVSYYK